MFTLAVTLLLPAGFRVSAQAGDNGTLSKYARALLAEAIANGQTEVTLLVASHPGENNRVANGITRLGGQVRYREDSIDYIRARVPVGQAEAVAGLSGVQAVDLDEVIPLEDPRPSTDEEFPAGSVAPTPQPAPGAGTPNNNPYMPIGDTGAAQFMAANDPYFGAVSPAGQHHSERRT